MRIILKYYSIFQDIIEIQQNALAKNSRVLIVDDLMATGGELNNE
jgi:adenine/guanine phosphoribosyltransferase-like PRPP-binding protein